MLDAIYALRREQHRNPEALRIGEPTLRRLVENAGVELPKDEDGETMPLAEPMLLYGVSVKLDDLLGEGFVIE